jgi:hypothetical protein
MRLARYLASLVTMAAVAAALAAPTAVGQGSEAEPMAHPASTGIQVLGEPSGAGCTAVTPATPPATGTFATSGGCVAHMGGSNIVVSGHLFGIESVDTTCNMEFDLRTSGAGKGYAVHQEFTQGTQGTCTRDPCDEPPARGWRFHLKVVLTPLKIKVFEILICLEDRGTSGTSSNRRHCRVQIPFTETANHRYTFTANDINASGTPRCELNGTFTTEATQVSPNEEGQSRTQIEVNEL